MGGSTPGPSSSSKNSSTASAALSAACATCSVRGVNVSSRVFSAGESFVSEEF